jgi:signal transduction histidine kinase
MAGRIESYRAGLRRYVGAVTQSQEDERRRIARELHDETAQSLIGLIRHMELYQASETNPARMSKFAELREMVGHILREVRQISRDLRPLTLEDLGLVSALHTLIHGMLEAGEHRPRIHLQVAGPETSLNPELELALYRIVQEALNNARHHAQASDIQVQLCFEPAAVRLEVKDDGQGFVVPAALTELAQRGSFGLMGIQERVWAVGGLLTIRSLPHPGTQLNVTVPRTAN